MTYNLVVESKSTSQCAQSLSDRVQDLSTILTRWGVSCSDSQLFVYPLEHQYTNSGLQLDLLKGKDCHRTRHVLRGCQEQGDFYALLGNMELVVVEPNCEGEDEEFWERETVLTHIVDVSGFPLLVDGAIKIPEDTLLRFVDLEGRCVDTKRGGGYLGNSHAEIEQVYKNSV